MKTVDEDFKNSYLYTGTGKQVYIEGIIDNKYLGRELMVFSGEYGEEETEGELRYFNPSELHEKKPLAKMDAELVSLQMQIEKKKIEYRKEENDLRAIQYELKNQKREQGKMEGMIFDRGFFKTCKRLTIFLNNIIAPHDFDMQNGHPFNCQITIQVNIRSGEERVWSYQWHDGEYKDGKYFEFYTFDLTDDEIMELNLMRQKEKVWDISTIERTPDKWLSPENLERKQNKIAQNEEAKKQNLQKEIELRRQQLEQLEAKKD